MIKVYYDDYCLRLELAIRVLIDHGLPFQCSRMKDTLREEVHISAGPIIFLDKELIGTLDALTFLLDKNPPAKKR
jgi:hypothetical protein